YRFDRNGWVYIHLEGATQQIGYQHGYLLSKETSDLLRVAKPFLLHETKRDWNFYRKASQEILWPKIDAEYQNEIDGIVVGLNDAGIKADRWDIVALNALEELPYYYVPWLDKQLGRVPTTHAPGNCSAMIATGSYTKDHRIVMGHNAWINYVVGERWNIIFDIKPPHGYRILKEHSLRRTSDGYFVGSNFPVDTKLATVETNFDFGNTGGSPLARKARWEQLVKESQSTIDVETVKKMESDRYDGFEKRPGPDERSLCGCVELSPRGIPEWDWGKFYPGGTVQAKAVDSGMASKMQLWAAMGHPCGYDFIAATFLKSHPEYRWMNDLLRDMKSYPLTEFSSGMVK